MHTEENLGFSPRSERLLAAGGDAAGEFSRMSSTFSHFHRKMNVHSAVFTKKISFLVYHSIYVIFTLTTLAIQVDGHYVCNGTL